MPLHAFGTGGCDKPFPPVGTGRGLSVWGTLAPVPPFSALRAALDPGAFCMSAFISLKMATALSGLSKRTLWRRIADGSLRTPAPAAEGGGGDPEITRVGLSEVAAWAPFKLDADDIDCILAADAGDIGAQCDLALLFLSHEQPAEAVQWLQGAARHYYPEAMHWLGRCLISGQGIEENTEEGIAWLRRAAERSHATATHMIAWLDAPDTPALRGPQLEAELDRIERQIVLATLAETADS